MTGDAMREVIEVLARALCAMSGDNPDEVLADGSSPVEPWRGDARILLEHVIKLPPPAARLALARAITPDTHAVVEHDPDEAMLDAGRDAPTLTFRATRREVRVIFQEMIAAARKESEHD